MKKMILIALFIFSQINAKAHYSLTVNSPSSWGNDVGTIEEATVSINPKGIYVEYGVYMTLSAKNSFFSNVSENLEINYQFELPANALVIDSWLWVDDVIIKADIRDAKSANTIYEGIVNRRKDPSILTKINATQYTLKIYPLIPGKSRKIKITYLVPSLWNTNQIAVEVPTQLFRNTKTPLSKLDIIFVANKTFSNPSIESTSNKFFTETVTPSGMAFTSSLGVQDIANPCTIKYNLSGAKSVFLSTYKSKEGIGYYELAIDPRKNLELTSIKKVALLLDYENGNSDLSKTALLDKIKYYLENNFSPTDSFNIVYNKIKVLKASENWMPADIASIAKTIKALKESSISSYSSLPELFTKGIDFINSKNTGGSLLLISNNKSFNNAEKANDLLTDIKLQMKPIIETSIIDYSNQVYEYEYYVNNKPHRRNEYLFTSIANYSKGISDGNYLNYKTIDNIFKNVFSNLDLKISNFELYTSLKNGTCYDRTLVSETFNNQTITANNYILQTGKYEGDMPMEIKLSGKVNSKLYIKSLTIEPEKSNNTSVMTASIGNEILGLENSIGYYTGQNSKHDEITDLSINNRILSIYTAFLALEPSDTVFACKDCIDETLVTGIENSSILDSANIEVFPNPFADVSTIKIKFPKNTNADDVNIQISDLIGKPVKNIALNILPTANATEFTWDGTNNDGASLPNGTYFLVLNTGAKNTAKKITIRR